MKKYSKSKLLKAYLNEKKERNWDNRFTNLKISEYDSYKDINYLSLGLFKAKIKYEKKEQKKLKRANSIKESTINKDIKLTSPNSDILLNNLSSSKISPKKVHNTTFINTRHNTNKNKYVNTLPNSCKKEKCDCMDKIQIYSRDKSDAKIIYKNINFSPLNKTNNYNFKESSHNKNIKNNYENDLLKKIQEDKELNEIYENLKVLWNNYGVTNLYQNNFLLSLNDYFFSKKSIYEFLCIERKQMLRFKNEYSLVIKKITQRNNELNNIKNLIKEYSNKDHTKNNIESDIKNKLKLIRLYTINLVSQIKKFYLINSHLILSGKINLSKIKIDNYNFDNNYLTNMKEELNFLKSSSINKLYDFSKCINDPFLLSISDIPEYNTNKKNNKNIDSKYEILPISDDIYMQIIKLLYFMNQIDINEKIEKQNKKITILRDDNNKNTLNQINNNSDNWLLLNNEIDIGNNYKGNINLFINKLKNKNNYDEIFYNTISNYNNNNFNKKNKKPEKLKTLNIYFKTDKNNKVNNINNKEDIPLTTAEQLQKKFKQYEEIKQLIENEIQK